MRLRSSFCTVCMAALYFLMGLGGSVASAQPASGMTPPQTLCITYRCSSLKRPATMRRIETVALPRIQQWCKGAPDRSVQLYTATTGAECGPWDAMMLLRCGSPGSLAAWCELERTMPSGLMPSEFDGIAEVHTSLVDLLAERNAPIDSSSLVLVRPYTFTDADIYPDYVRAYLVPEFESWRSARALAGYIILVNRFPEGSAWDIMLVQHYVDAAALSRREDVRGSTIDSLRKNPAWTLLHDGKETFRTSTLPENITVITRPVVLDADRKPD